jgi:ribonuclease VapC
MIVDSSAIVAIIRNEPDAAEYATALVNARSPKMSAANLLETAIVIDSARDPVASRRFDALIESAGIEIVAISTKQAKLARLAYRDFGRGSPSAAKLNFGDCFAHALAADVGEPLLFKGTDFLHTDLIPALPDARA